MKSYLFLLILVLFALPGVAGGNTYCKTRSTITEAQRCYAAVNEQSLKSVRNLYVKIEALPAIRNRAAQMRVLLQDVDKELIKAVSGCETFDCEYDLLERTRKDLLQAYREFGGQ